ncbi:MULTISPECIES: hypothetical protein [Burkholderia]|jgi:amino acid transporter|uniref:hypothetical protein n=1 Tax=Burkholderia TaxID=32008 RepID=UPI0010415DD4|nr:MULTISPECIES: hypothetical protein [Burkholderia]NIF54980.1 hypothetical protein [Burkholderia sp. Ax-1724]
MHDLNPVPPPLTSVAVFFTLLGIFVGSSVLATIAGWVRHPNAVLALITGLFVLAMVWMVYLCWPFLRKPKPTQTRTEGSTS